ncbi:MAG: xanthomonadin biosynthesis acyl carrier protein XanC [Methylohalobius crimeensis]
MSTTTHSDLIQELKTLLIQGLHLEDVAPEDIDPHAPLFGEGLGLDSIDALEIGVMLDRRYGIKLVSNDERNARVFASLESLAEFVAAHRAR